MTGALIGLAALTVAVFVALLLADAEREREQLHTVDVESKPETEADPEPEYCGRHRPCLQLWWRRQIGALVDELAAEWRQRNALGGAL